MSTAILFTEWWFHFIHVLIGWNGHFSLFIIQVDSKFCWWQETHTHTACSQLPPTCEMLSCEMHVLTMYMYYVGSRTQDGGRGAITCHFFRAVHSLWLRCMPSLHVMLPKCGSASFVYYQGCLWKVARRLLDAKLLNVALFDVLSIQRPIALNSEIL